jgi:Planctomycete cytochrome C
MNRNGIGALCLALALCLMAGIVASGCTGGDDAGKVTPEPVIGETAGKVVPAAPPKEKPAPAKDDFTPAIRPIDDAEAAKVTYAADVAPILKAQCVPCHEGDQAAEGLDLSTVEGMLKGGEHGEPAFVAGKPDDSPLVQYIRGIKEPKMPKGKREMSEDDLHVIRMWIAAGAKAGQ